MNIYNDIFLQDGERLTFGNARLKLELGKNGGEWLSLHVAGSEGNLLSPARPTPALDFIIDGQRMIEQNGATLTSYNTSIDRRHQSVSLHLVLAVTGHPEWELTSTYTLFPGQGRLERAARLARGAADKGKVPHLNDFVFSLPGVALGDPAGCTIDAPGPWFPNTYVAPNTPYAKLVSQNIGLHGAPDGGFGLLAMSNAALGLCLASWMDTAGEVNYNPALRGDGKRLSFVFTDHRAYRMSERLAVSSDTQRIEAAPSLVQALHAYRAMCEQTMPLDAHTPDWAREMVLLEILPSYFPGGFKEIAQKLPFYKEIGFNTIYLMPHWKGGYSPIDLFEVDPALGRPAELKQMVRTAHDLGMKVLFDMVIHGFNEKSPLMAQRPELFIHDEQGQIARHPTWKSMSTDWASPAYQQYMVDVVLHDLREYDNDGYRVDAASFKAPNWDPRIPYPAYRSATASPELMEKMLRAMQGRKPDAVLLSEVFGPVFYQVSNLVHDNQTEAPQQFLEKMEAGERTAADYKSHMANVFDLLPRGANRVFFARNHDTSWFYHFNGYTSRFMALDAVHVLCAIPEIFAGDPNNGPHPDADPKTYDFYRKLFALRRDFPELARGELLLRQVECDNPHVFTALRRLNGRIALIAISLSDKAETANLSLAAGFPASPQGARLLDPISGAVAGAAPSGNRQIRLQCKPFQVLIGRL